jgi:hypothetical protein
MADGPSALDEQIAVRLPSPLLVRIRDRQSRMRDASRGVNVTFSDVVRSLIVAGLSAVGEP